MVDVSQISDWTRVDFIAIYIGVSVLLKPQKKYSCRNSKMLVKFFREFSSEKTLLSIKRRAVKLMFNQKQELEPPELFPTYKVGSGAYCAAS